MAKRNDPFDIEITPELIAAGGEATRLGELTRVVRNCLFGVAMAPEDDVHCSGHRYLLQREPQAARLALAGERFGAFGNAFFQFRLRRQ